MEANFNIHHNWNPHTRISIWIKLQNKNNLSTKRKQQKCLKIIKIITSCWARVEKEKGNSSLLSGPHGWSFVWKRTRRERRWKNCTSTIITIRVPRSSAHFYSKPSNRNTKIPTAWLGAIWIKCILFWFEWNVFPSYLLPNIAVIPFYMHSHICQRKVKTKH